VCAAISIVATLAVVIALDELTAGVIFLLSGLAAGIATRRPAAWLVPLAAASASAAIDLTGAASPRAFSDDLVIFYWLLAATPGMVVAGLVGAVLRRTRR
jgi:hypothetical protein